jgi:hypothetical protein
MSVTADWWFWTGTPEREDQLISEVGANVQQLLRGETIGVDDERGWPF